MWTPRRVIMVVTGLLLFSGGFTVYSSLFGWIDGLPPLPEALTHPAVEGSALPGLLPGLTPIQSRIRQAFGPNCVELTQAYNIKFEVREKGIIFAAADSKILDDGRVQFQQLSVAIFGKSSPEISTIHADRAFITFDQPIRRMEDMASRKVVAAQLHSDPDFKTDDPRRGKVHIINNRKTANPDDDMILKTPGPVFYVDEPKPSFPNIWTTTAVEVVDRQNRPAPSQVEKEEQLPTVTGEGMRVFLTSEPPSAPGTPPKKRDAKNPGGVSGVERIELERNVVMNLWSESRNMFGPDSTKNPPPKRAVDAPPAEKVLIQVHSNGPFYYDLHKDFAHFEVPPPSDPAIQDYVKVTRRSKGRQEDTLNSDFLDIQFRRRKEAPEPIAAKPPLKPAPVLPVREKSTSPQSDLDMETVHAWGANIAVSSDENNLFAYGNDLFYNALIKQTIMKGLPMHAVKEGNLIRSPELIMLNFDDPEKQETRARGPGSIGMGEIDPKSQEHGQQAHWQDWMVVTKVKENGKDLDLITLTGGSTFVDTINQQRLRGDRIKVWLLGNEDKKPEGKAKTVAKLEPKKKADGKSEERKPMPQRLEAVGNVYAFSPDLIVHKTGYLNVWFKDLPASSKALSEKLPEAREQPVPKDPLDIGPPPIVKADSFPPLPKTDPLPKKNSTALLEKKDPPIELRQARRVETWVNRIDGKNELDKVHCEGEVVIHQDKTPGNERDVDIAGHTVDMEYHSEGNFLIVTGNDKLIGEVHFDKISIIGDDIRIDQRDNTANVKGPGSMRLLSDSDLKGDKLIEPTWTDINWNDGMRLEGPDRKILYDGQVQAMQKEGKILCETMEVTLDRPVYLNQAFRQNDPMGKKKGDAKESAKIERILCDQMPPNPMGPQPKFVKPVSVEDFEKLNGKLIRYQNVLGTQVMMDNTNNKMIANGPGTVIIFQKGSTDPLADKSKDGKRNELEQKKTAGPEDEEMKLTWVKFDQRMIAFNNMPKRAVFYSNVEVLHMPSSRHDVEINIAKLTPRALYIRCEEKFEVTTQSRKGIDKDGKPVEFKWQEMVAVGNVRVRNDDFDGWSGTMTYSEEKSLIVFTGTVRNPAVMNRAEVVGGPRKTFRGKRILYNVKSKDFNVEDSVGGSSN